MGTVGLIHCQSEVFFMFSFRNVKVAAQGHYCVRKRHHSVGFRARSNVLCFISQFYLAMNYCLVCDVTPQWPFFIVLGFYMGNIQSEKQGNLLIIFCFSGADDWYKRISEIEYFERKCHLITVFNTAI